VLTEAKLWTILKPTSLLSYTARGPSEAGKILCGADWEPSPATRTGRARIETVSASASQAPSWPRNNFDGLMISVLNFGLSFEVEAQFQYSLPFGTTEIFPDLAFVVMLEAHAVKLLSQLSVFEFGL